MGDDLVLGAMMFGTAIDESRAFELLDRYVDAGGRWIDTADCYAFWGDPSGFGGQSEAVIGRWLARRPGARDRVLLSTKVGSEPTEAGRFPETAIGLAAATVKAGIAGSLERLGTDHVDLYWAHMPDPRTPLEETVEALDALVSAGQVGRLGLSNHAVWQVERAREIARARGRTAVSAAQHHLTYLQPRPGTRPTSAHRFGTVTDELVHYVEQHPDVSLWAYTPLLTGSYVRQDRPLPAEYDHPGTTARLAALDEVVAETGTDRNQVVLAWLTGGDPGITPIVGVSSPDHLDSAFAGAALTLTAEQRARLDAAR